VVDAFAHAAEAEKGRGMALRFLLFFQMEYKAYFTQ